MVAAQLALFPEPDTSTAEIESPTPLLAPVRAERGDLWQLGRHRLLCGDATRVDDVARLMGGVKVGTCITDPPYGIAFNTNYHRFTGGVAKTRNWLVPITGDTQPFDPRHLLRFTIVVLWGANCYSERLPRGSWLVWDKRFKNGKAFLSDGEVAWMNRGHGVYIHSITSQGFIRPEPITHPTQKPIALLEWCMEKAKAGQRVYDPYLGSGTTLIACERTGRVCYGMEIEPRYCDIILRRWEQATGQTAILLERVTV